MDDINCRFALASCTSKPPVEVIGGPTIGPAAFFGPGPSSEKPPLLKDPVTIANSTYRLIGFIAVGIAELLSRLSTL